MKKLLLLLLTVCVLTPTYAKTNKQTVTLYCDILCQACCDKVMKNIAFEKGVKDIQFDLKEKAIIITYDADKTDVPTLQKALAKMGKPATTTKPTEKAKTDNKSSDKCPTTNSKQ